MLASSILFLPPPSPDGRKVSQTPESTVWRSVWAAGARTQQEEEEVEVEEGRQGRKCLWVHLTSLRAASQNILIKKAGILALYPDPDWLLRISTHP